VLGTGGGRCGVVKGVSVGLWRGGFCGIGVRVGWGGGIWARLLRQCGCVVGR